MIKRLVKLSFREECVPEFLELFRTTRAAIRGFEGCQHLELLRHHDNTHIFFTFSIWENEEALERYRHSDLFKTTWAATKALFAHRADAWSTMPVEFED